jgi:hypothetical protein
MLGVTCKQYTVNLVFFEGKEGILKPIYIWGIFLSGWSIGNEPGAVHSGVLNKMA